MDTTNKPYFFVPANKVKPAGAKGDHSGRLEVTITAVTPLHFGAGILSFKKNGTKENEFCHSLSRENGKIALPGTAFKGMLRTLFEAVSQSCILTNKDGSAKQCSSNSDICPACDLFGRLGKKGRLGFSSFVLVGTFKEPQPLCLPQLYGPRKQHTLPDHRKFYKHSDFYEQIIKKAKNKHKSALYECLPVGAVLKGDITYQNLTEDQLGGLLFALGVGWGAQIYHKLGYAKPVFLGSVRLNVTPTPSGASIFVKDTLTIQKRDSFAAGYYANHENDIKDAVDAIRQQWAFNKLGSDRHGWNEVTLTY